MPIELSLWIKENYGWNVPPWALEETLGDYWLMALRLYHEAQNDPAVIKYREKQKKKQERRAKGSARDRSVDRGLEVHEGGAARGWFGRDPNGE